MSIDKFFPLLSIIILCNSSLNAQDENVIYNDTLTKNLFQIKKDYSKRIFESTYYTCLLYTSPSPRDVEESRMPSSA